MAAPTSGVVVSGKKTRGSKAAKAAKAPKAPRAPKAEKAPKSLKAPKLRRGAKADPDAVAEAEFVALHAPLTEVPSPTAYSAAPGEPAAEFAPAPIDEQPVAEQPAKAPFFTLTRTPKAPKALKVPRAERAASSASPTPTTAGLAVAFVAASAAFMAWGQAVAAPSGATPWSPAVGLALAAVVLGGRAWLPIVFGAALLAMPLDPGFASSPMGPLLHAVFSTAVFGGAGLVLRQRLSLERPMERVSDAWWIIGVGVVAAPAVSPVLYGVAFTGLGITAPHGLAAETIRTYVLGDALGVLSIAPLVIVFGAAVRRFGFQGLRPTPDMLRPESLLALISLAVLTPVIYLGGGEDLRAVGTLPLCWLALRYGVAGAVIGAFTWAGSAALLLSVMADDGKFNGLQAFLLTGGMLALIIGTVVSDRGRTQRELRHLALHDQDSGLPNEPHLLELIDEALQNARGLEVTAMTIHFAGLRQVAAALRRTDTDQLVTNLTQSLISIAGHEALIARPGFDRFAVLLSGADAARRQEIATGIIDLLAQPLAVESREVFVDPRVGITVGGIGEAADVVLAHAVHAADVALADNNRIGYYDASIERAHRNRMELTEDLRLAVERGEFLLAFQPIVTAKEGIVVAAEALLRWVDQKRGPVPPMDFIPVAEETGLILPIGRWVLNEACRRATAWPHVAGEAIAVSVNVSPIQLMDEGFTQDVADALENSGLPASRLRVEITEGIQLEDIERTILRITQLREMGVDTMLDDFGTGHSSLAWVQRLPVSCIKIDRAFVRDVANDGIDRAIVHASLYLSRALGTETIAEGVETEAQREQLVRMGCQKVQGYLFARPQPADVFPDWLAKKRNLAMGAIPPPAPRPVPVHAVTAARPATPPRMAPSAGVHAAPMPSSVAVAAPPAPQYAPAPVAAPAYAEAPAPAAVYASAPGPAYAAAPMAPPVPVAPPVAPPAYVPAPGPAPVPQDPRYVA